MNEVKESQERKAGVDRASVLRDREAFVIGFLDGLHGDACSLEYKEGRQTSHSYCEHTERAKKRAAEIFPLPKVSRPRVVTYGAAWYKMQDGDLFVSNDSGLTWREFGSALVGESSAIRLPHSGAAEFLRVLAGLLDNPTELCDAE